MIGYSADSSDHGLRRAIGLELGCIFLIADRELGQWPVPTSLLLNDVCKLVSQQTKAARMGRGIATVTEDHVPTHRIGECVYCTRGLGGPVIGMDPYGAEVVP